MMPQGNNPQALPMLAPYHGQDITKNENEYDPKP
jgi:hypothetical protein